MVEETIRAGRPRNQNIMIENRKKMSITGVSDVLRFADNNVIMKTDLGQLVVKGSSLRIVKLDLENTLVEIEGLIEAVDYSGKSGGLGKIGKSGSANSATGANDGKADKPGLFNKYR